MKKLLLFILFLPLFCTPGYAQGKAAISFVNRDSVYDFGGIALGTKARYQFEIKNTGDAPLTITDVKSETGAFKFKWSGKPVKPHKKTEIYVTYTPGENTDVGTFKTNVLITSNATPQPYPYIHLSGEVLPPGRTHVITPPPGQEHEGVITPLSHSNPPQ